MRIRLFQTESFRLAATYAAIFLTSILLFSVLVYLTVDTAFRAEALKAADADIAAVTRAYNNAGVSEAIEAVDRDLAAPRASDIFLLQQNGIKLAGNIPPMPAGVGVQELSPQGLPVLGRGVLVAPDLYVFAGRDLSIMRETQNIILKALAWIFGGALIVAAAGGIIISRTFLGRVEDIIQTCRAVMEGHFADRVPLRGNRDEMDRLAVVINEMLDRIAALMENLKQVSGDIAHDLRTPLTRFRNYLERAGSEARNEEEYVTVLQNALAETDEILGLFTALLRISQIESRTRKAGFVDIDLAVLVRQVADIYRAVAEDSKHGFSVAIWAPATVKGDRDLMIQLLANLVENAIRHTPPGTDITIGMEKRDNAPILFVADNGPGIPPDKRDKLFRRFTRLEQSRTTPGHGLGLALVAAIVDLHGATVAIVDEQPGTRIEMRFA